MSCASVVFGLFSINCESRNKFIGISETVIENVTRTMVNTENRAVTRLDTMQTIKVFANEIDCTYLDISNNVDVDVVVNQEIDEEARLSLINAISQVTQWDAILNNEQLTGLFNNPANNQKNDVEIATYFRALTENTLTVSRLNSITSGMYIGQNIELYINRLSGINCTIQNNIMVKVFVSQALYAVLEAFANNSYDIETTTIIKQSLRREQTGLFGKDKKGKKGIVLLGLLAIGLLIGGGLLIFMLSKKKGGSQPVPNSPINQTSRQNSQTSRSVGGRSDEVGTNGETPLLSQTLPISQTSRLIDRASRLIDRDRLNTQTSRQNSQTSRSVGGRSDEVGTNDRTSRSNDRTTRSINRSSDVPLYRQRSSQPSTE